MGLKGKLKKYCFSLGNLCIRQKLTISNWVVSIIPIIMIFSIISVVFFSITLNNAKQQAQISLDKAVDEVDLWLSQTYEGIVSLSTDINIQNAIAAYIVSDYKEKLNIRDFIRNRLITVYTSDMKAINVSLYINEEHKTFSKDFTDTELYSIYNKTEWFNNVLDGKISNYLGETKSINIGKSVLIMASPIVSVRNGKVLGLAYVELDKNKVFDAFKVLVENNSNAVLLGSEGVKSPAYDSNEKTVSVKSRIERINLDVEYLLQVKELFNGYNYALIYFVCGLILIMSLMYISDTLLAKGFSNRIISLRNAMKEIAGGNLSVEVKDSQRDEIGELSQSLNTMAKEMATLIQERYVAEIENSNATLIALQSQINPHFIYNTLESISMLALIKDNYEIVEITQAFSDMMRYSMESNSLVRIQEELDNVRNYVAIQKIRFPEKFEVIYNVNPNCLEATILRLSLQPLVENAFKHGFENDPKHRKLAIYIRRATRYIIIRIFNDGATISKERINRIVELLNPDNKETTMDCFALRNLSRRLRIAYGVKCGFTIHSKIGMGTIITIRLPISNVEGER